MKSILSNTFALLTLLLLLPATLLAQGLVGECADCHTMHNSEQGQPVAQVGLAGTISNTPNQNLLKFDCIACHAQGGSDKIVGLSGGSQIPQVYHDDITDLAAGNFAYISGFKQGHEGTSGNRKGHNVVDLVAADNSYATPPGFTLPPPPGYRNHGTNFDFDLNQFTCAGSMGCHGYRGQILTVDEVECDPFDPDCTATSNIIYRTGLNALSGFEALDDFKRGAHHENFEGLKSGGSSPEFAIHPLSNSYRFLYAMRGQGNEVDRWQNIDENSHNEYFGVANRTTNFDTVSCGGCHLGSTTSATYSRIYAPYRSMTGFCLTCHGNFHSSGEAGPGNGSSGAFLRHPSDYVIPDRGEYAAYTAYNVTAPVARPDMATIGDSAAVRPGTDMVMCLSCHVAHAAPYDDMLRFDYDAMVAGGYADVGTATAEGGCLACHTTKGVLKQPTTP